MRQNNLPLLVLSLLFCCFSCTSYKLPTHNYTKKLQPKTKELVLEHWLYTVVPRHRSQIHWFDLPRWGTWALFGNDDDGVFGEEETAKFKTDKEISFSRALDWNLRNPLHNFTFYVIGQAQFKNSEFAILQLSKEKNKLLSYQPEERTVFGGKGSSLFIALHGFKPFFSLRLNYGRLFECYLGWRPKGNFGIKFILAKKPPKKTISNPTGESDETQ